MVFPLVLWWILVRMNVFAAPGTVVEPPFNLSDRLSTLSVEEVNGELRLRFESGLLTGEEFLELVQKRKAEKAEWGWLFRKLDITGWASLAWVGFGFLAQAVFMGRMLVQWMASERAKTSVVPPSFWWLSLMGASMLIVYYIWRKDPVSIVAQSFGWTVYLRNLWFIYARSGETKEG